MADPADEVIEELRQIDPNGLTPMDALKQIAKWREKLK
jgi:hypothetical protein